MRLGATKLSQRDQNSGAHIAWRSIGLCEHMHIIAHMHSLALFFVGGLWRRAGQLSTMVRTWLCAALPFVPCRPHLPRRLADGRVVRQPR